MPIRSAAEPLECSFKNKRSLRNSSIGWSLIRKTSLSSDRSDGVRSSSRHKHRFATASHVPFGTTSARVPMLGDCASITTCVTIDSRSDPTSSRCQISVSHHAPTCAACSSHMRRGIVFDGRAFDLGKLSDKRDIIAMSTSAMSGAISTGAISTGGARRDRTDDLLLAKQALSQLSYGPPQGSVVRGQQSEKARRSDYSLLITDGWNWWAWEDLNFRPHAYQARALTN